MISIPVFFLDWIQGTGIKLSTKLDGTLAFKGSRECKWSQLNRETSYNLPVKFLRSIQLTFLIWLQDWLVFLHNIHSTNLVAFIWRAYFFKKYLDVSEVTFTIQLILELLFTVFDMRRLVIQIKILESINIFLILISIFIKM